MKFLLQNKFRFLDPLRKEMKESVTSLLRLNDLDENPLKQTVPDLQVVKKIKRQMVN